LNKKYKDHRRYLIYSILLDFLTSKKQLKSIINKYIKNLPDRDKNYIFEITNGSIQNFLFINKIITANSTLKNSNQTKSVLIFSIYNLLFSKNIPDYAIIDNAVNLAKELKLKNFNFINALLRKVSRNKKINFNENYINYSYPKWLYDKLLRQIGKKNLTKLIDWNITNRDIYIRAISKESMNEIQDYFNKLNINHKVFNDYKKYLKINKINNTIANYLSINKLGYVQSPSSGFVVKLLNPKSNEKIIDACSSPGGKLIYISNILKNTNKLYAYEIDKKRYYQLKENIKNYQCNNIYTFNEDFRKCKLKNIDKILIDVPCTGTGIIHRKPDIKIRRKHTDIIKFTELQYSLLNYASRIINNNGIIVYSTCSIIEDENWMVVNKFLSNNKNFKLINSSKYIDQKYIDSRGALNIKPYLHSLDGMFAVRLKKIS
tara:strand:- start:7478 stop:8773 length:1296 start_codon:yes stop_codon:yes gene_type:complete